MKRAIIYIYDYIGSDAVNSNYIRQIVTQYEDQGITAFELHINSMGGSVFEGIAIYNFLKGKDVEVFIDGVAASIASVVAMCGKKVNMYSSSMMMIHNPWTFSDGDSNELIKQAEMLEQVKKSIISAYQEKTKKSKSDLEDMMNSETWLTAQEAKSQGFCDDIVKIKNETREYVAVYAMVKEDKPSLNPKENKMNKKLLAFLGLPENATDDQIEAKLVGLRKDFGLDENSTMEDVFKKMKASLDDDPPADPPADPPTDPPADPPTNAQLEELLNDRAEALINDAVNDFKILAVDKPLWINQAKTDYKGTKALLDGRPKDFAKPGKLPVDKKNTSPDGKPTTVQAASDFFKEQGREKKSK